MKLIGQFAMMSHKILKNKEVKERSTVRV